MAFITPDEENELTQKYGMSPHSRVFSSIQGLPRDDAAKVLRYSRQFNMPAQDVAANLGSYDKSVIEPNWDEVTARSPKTAAFLYDPMNMAVARNQENIRRLEEIEGGWKVWRQLKNSTADQVGGLLGGIIGPVESAMNAPNTPANYITNEINQANRLQPQNQHSDSPIPTTPQPLVKADALRSALNSNMLKPGAPVRSDFGGEVPGLGGKTWGDVGYGIVGMIPQMIGQFGAMALGGPVGSFAYNAAQIGGSQYLDLTDGKDENGKPTTPVDPQRALVASMGNALTQAWMEQISLNKMFKKLPANSPAAYRWKERAEATLTEVATEWIQQYPEAAAEIWAQNPGMKREEMASLFAKDFVKNTQEGIFQGLVAAPFGFLGRSISLKMQEKATERFVQQIETTRQQLQKSDLLGLSPEATEAHLAAVMEGQSAFLDPEAVMTLYQSDSFLSQEEINELLGTSLAKVEEAIRTGEMIEIPLAKYTVATAQRPEIGKMLDEHIAANEEGATISWATERKNVEDVRKSAEAIKLQRDELQAETDKLHAQLDAAGATKEHARSIVSLLVKNAQVMSENPAQWLREKAPQFVKGVVKQAGAMGQSAPEAKNFLDKAKDFIGKITGTVQESPVKSPEEYRQAYKGSIHWQDGKAIISLFETADPSTLIHETVGHYFLENLMTEGAKDESPDWMKRDRQTVLDHVGIEDWNSATKEQKTDAHEKMARSAEAYFMTGEAPSIETRSAFRRFKEWLINVYHDVSALDVNVTTEIKGVFDRMLATQEQIHQTEILEGYHARLPDAVLKALKPSQVAMLDRMISRARQKAEDILQGRMMEFIRADSKAAREQERTDAIERIGKEVAAEPFYALVDQIEADWKGENPKTIAQRYLNTALPQDQELHFDMIAEAAGYTSGMHLATEIKERNDKAKETASRVDDHMQSWRDVFEDPAAMQEEARQAMYSEDGALLLAVEQQIIEEKLTGVLNAEESRKAAQQNREVHKSQARKLFENKTIEDAIKLQAFIAAERRAAEKAAKYLAEGNLPKAAEQKNVQGLAHAMVQESLTARREFERINKYLKRQQKSDRKTWITEEHWQQAADILNRFGFSRKDYKGQQTEPLATYLARMEEENHDMLAVADWLANDRDPKNSKKLTLSQFKDVEGAVRNIKQMARFGANSDAFLTMNGDGLSQTVDNLVNDAETNVADVQIDEIGEKPDPSVWAEMMAGMKKPSILFRKLSGKDFGHWANALYYKLVDASNYESTLMNRVVTALESAYESEGITKAQRYQDAHKKIYIQEWGQSVTKNTLRAILLNMGSESNLSRMAVTKAVGYRGSAEWNQQTVTAVLEKYLAASDFRLTQKIWDSINLYDEYTAMVKKVTGFPMSKVEPQPITFNVGGETIHLSGGYYPLKQDWRGNKQAELNAEKDIAGGGAGVMPYPNTGSSKRRLSGAKYAVDYDFGNLTGAMKQTVHDIAFRPIAIDTNKLMRQDAIKDVLRRKLGDANYLAITKWQNTVQKGKDSDVESSGMFDRGARWLRQQTVIANLLFRVGTVFQNTANFTLYGNSVEGFSEKDAYASFMKYGVMDYIPKALSGSEDAAKIRQWVYENSAMMRDKMKNPDYSFRELVQSKDNLLTNSRNDTVRGAGITLAITHDNIVKFGSKILAFSDQLTDVSMWRGAYFKSMEDGNSHAQAVQFADTVIERSTGTGRTIDTSAMQRGGPIEKTLTMFMTFLNGQYNRWALEKDIFLKEKDVMRLVSFVASKYLMFGIISAIASFKTPGEDDDKLKWFVKEVMEWPLSMIPVGGSAAKYLIDSAMGFHTFGYQLSPIERSVTGVLNTAMLAGKVLMGTKDKADLAEPLMQQAAFLFGYPDQFNDWFMNGYDIMTGQMEAKPIDLIRRRPKREHN